MVFANPLRALPLYNSAGRVFGPSALAHAEGAYRIARDACDFILPLSRACAALARANQTRPENRRRAQGDAFRAINALRRDRAAAWKRRDAAEVALYAAGGSAAAVDAADAARCARHATADVLPTGCMALADDPDMAGASWLRPATPIASAPGSTPAA